LPLPLPLPLPLLCCAVLISIPLGFEVRRFTDWIDLMHCCFGSRRWLCQSMLWRVIVALAVSGRGLSWSCGENHYFKTWLRSEEWDMNWVELNPQHNCVGWQIVDAEICFDDSAQRGQDGVIELGLWSNGEGITFHQIASVFYFRNQQNSLISLISQGPLVRFSTINHCGNIYFICISMISLYPSRLSDIHPNYLPQSRNVCYHLWLSSILFSVI
jgi:hypothetical protein